jgi:hypothetical protein
VVGEIMRSENYQNQKLTFTKLEPLQMERTALLEGLAPENPNLQDYKKVIKEHVPSGAWLYIDRIVELRYKQADLKKRNESLTPLERVYLKDSLEVLRPRPLLTGERADYTFWRGIRKSTLEDIGLITKAPESLEGIVDKALLLRRWQVMALNEALAKPISEYKNNIKPEHKLRIDNKAAVSRFAAEKGICLPDNYLKDGRMNAGIVDLLRANDFNIWEAISNSAKDAKDKKPNSKLVAISFTNYSTGDESRIYPLDIVEAFEHYLHFGPEKTKIALGDASGKYGGHQSLFVPKRTPTEDFKYDQVTLDYLAELYNNPSSDPMWWINARMGCSCEYASIHSFFKKSKGEKKRMAHILIDAHTGNSLLTIFNQLKKENRGVELWRYMPIPSQAMAALADTARYNMLIYDGSKRLREEDINILLLELVKNNPKSAFLSPNTAGFPDSFTKPYFINPLNKI